MRIIGGKHRSRIIEMVGIDSTRETADKVRGAIFNLISSYSLYDQVCLDLFSGSGSMGLEALSRGAKYVYFNDKNAKAYTVTKKNIHNLGLDLQSEVFNLDYKIALKRVRKPLDFVFLDPPYKLNCYQEIMEELIEQNLLNKEALIICEAHKDVKILTPKAFELYKEKCYGIKKVVIYRRCDTDEI